MEITTPQPRDRRQPELSHLKYYIVISIYKILFELSIKLLSTIESYLAYIDLYTKLGPPRSSQIP